MKNRENWRDINIPQFFFFDRIYHKADAGKIFFPPYNSYLDTEVEFDGRLQCSAGTNERMVDLCRWIILITDNAKLTYTAKGKYFPSQLGVGYTCPKVMLFPTGHFLMHWQNYYSPDIIEEEKRFVDCGALHLHYEGEDSWTYSDVWQLLEIDGENFTWSISWYQNFVIDKYHHKKFNEKRYKFAYPIKKKIIGLAVPSKIDGIIEEVVIKNGVMISQEYRDFWTNPTYDEIIRIPAHTYDQNSAVYTIVNVTDFGKLSILLNSKDLRLSISPYPDYPPQHEWIKLYWGIDSDYIRFQQFNVIEIPVVISGMITTAKIKSPFCSQIPNVYLNYIPWDFYYGFGWLQEKYQYYYEEIGNPGHPGDGFYNCFDLYYYDQGYKIGFGPIVDCAMGNSFALGIETYPPEVS